MIGKWVLSFEGGCCLRVEVGGGREEGRKGVVGLGGNGVVGLLGLS